MLSKEILILNGSPREKGNSAALAERVAAGAREAGAQVRTVYLHAMDIRPCDACDLCQEQLQGCIIQDDMQELYPALASADGIVLASPVYWFTYSAQLKVCIDRWYGLWNSAPKALMGKRIGIVLAYGDTDLYTSGGINAIHTFETMFHYLQSEIVGWVYGSLMDVGDAQKHPDLLDRAYQLGRQLVLGKR